MVFYKYILNYYKKLIKQYISNFTSKIFKKKDKNKKIKAKKVQIHEPMRPYTPGPQKIKAYGHGSTSLLAHFWFEWMNNESFTYFFLIKLDDTLFIVANNTSQYSFTSTLNRWKITHKNIIFQAFLLLKTWRNIS